MTNRKVTIKVSARSYEDADDCLSAAAADIVDEMGMCDGYDVNPRWGSDERDFILMDVPAAHAAGLCGK